MKYIREPTIFVDRETGEIIEKKRFEILKKNLLILNEQVETKTEKKDNLLIIKTIKSYETEKRQTGLF